FSTADEAGVDEGPDDFSDPGGDNSKKKAIDPKPSPCHRGKREKNKPSVRAPPPPGDEADCQADNEQHEQRRPEPPSQSHDVEGIIRRGLCVHRTLHLLAEKSLRTP